MLDIGQIDRRKREREAEQSVLQRLARFNQSWLAFLGHHPEHSRQQNTSSPESSASVTPSEHKAARLQVQIREKALFKRAAPEPIPPDLDLLRSLESLKLT